jgi:16S rRNA (guanine527-N7)-methyltransferase
VPYNLQQTVRILSESGIQIDNDQQQVLGQYVELLLDWNDRVNLISRKDVAEVWRNHILHSLAALTVTDIPDDALVIDVGTGGGLPGIPLAIMLPQVNFILTDSIAKKMLAVEGIVEQLGLKNLRCITGRVEELAKQGLLTKPVDYILARATARLNILLDWSRDIVAKNFCMIAWKGGALEDEIQEALKNHPDVNVTMNQFVLKDEDYFQREDKCLVIARR